MLFTPQPALAPRLIFFAPAPPSRRRLVKDLTPRSQSQHASGKLVVAAPPVREDAPHKTARDEFKEREAHKQTIREIVDRKRQRLEHTQLRRKGRWHSELGQTPGYKARAGGGSGARTNADVPNFDKPWRTSKDRLDAQKQRADSFGVKHPAPASASASASMPESASAAPPRKPQVYNPLSDEFDNSARAVSTRELPSAFASPPLMPGLLASVHALLGAQARPTPIQALSLKHLFKRKLDAPANPNTDNAWLQALLAAETGSGKSMAYLLPMLQDLKLAELQDASGAAQRAKTHGLMGPRALVLAPTHELSRQLSGFAKGLLHNIKLRVLCVSNKNLPARESKSVTAAQMAKLADAFVEGDDAAGPEMRKQLGEVDVAVGTPAKILEMVKGRNWDYVEPPEEEWPVDDRGHKVAPRQRHLGRPSMRLERVEWVVVDEADVLFGMSLFFMASPARLLT